MSYSPAGVYVLDTCSIIGDPVEQLLRCVSGHTRILGVLDATGTTDGGTRSSHPDLPLLSVSEPHRLPPEQRARVSTESGAEERSELVPRREQRV